MIDKYVGKSRILRLLRSLLDNPNGYTKKQLAENLGVSHESIKKDIEVLRNNTFEVECDKNNRYKLVLEDGFEQLKDLLHFTEEDQVFLGKAIETHDRHSKKGERILKKLHSLYDYHRLGHPYLRRPYLMKINQLEQAKLEKCQIILKGYYSSNSNTIKDRFVEVFHLSLNEDILHAFDLEIEKIRHFRISRINRIEQTPNSWQFESKHKILATDPFRISNDEQVMVHLRLKVGAYNELTESYPVTKQYIEFDAEEEGIFDFQCKVNAGFLGLTNFILGYHHQLVEVVEPESLILHLQKKLQEIQNSLLQGM
ncbi:MAG: WYL domain-containing protein [Chitinophagales bacterium]